MVELTETDEKVFKSIGDILMEKGGPGRIIVGSQLIDKVEPLGISEEDVNDSLEILQHEAFLKIRHTGSIKHSAIITSSHGFLVYYGLYLPDFREKRKEIISAIVNKNIKSVVGISEETGANKILIQSLLDYYGVDYLKLQRGEGGYSAIYKITALGKRKFDEILKN